MGSYNPLEVLERLGEALGTRDGGLSAQDLSGLGDVGLLHKLREHFVLVAEICLELFYPLAFDLEFIARLLPESQGAVLKKHLLPTVEDRGLKVLLVTKI